MTRKILHAQGENSKHALQTNKKQFRFFKFATSIYQVPWRGDTCPVYMEIFDNQ